MITLIKYIIINIINYHTYHNSQLSILNSQLNKLQFTSCRGKLRRLWRPAVATHPPIAETPISSVSRGDTYLSETHCKLRRSAAVGRADSLSPSLGSAKRDRLFFSTSYGKRQSPFGELYGVEVSHVPTAALLRSLQWVS